jgi:murein DD-endopeptidase MepM/ murein hydrolase activator NlpD
MGKPIEFRRIFSTLCLRGLVVLLILLLLAACSSDQGRSDPARPHSFELPPDEDHPLLATVEDWLFSQPHSTPTWTIQRSPYRSPTSSSTPLTSTSAPTIIKTATSTPLPPFVVCSPILSLRLEEIWRFISLQYLPPPPGSDDRHQGIDIVYYQLDGVVRPIRGEIVQSVLPGRVAAALTDTYPMGGMVIIETPYAWISSAIVESLKIPEDRSLYLLYAHLGEVMPFNLSDQISACQPIGKVGDTGNTNSPHLHLETRLGPPDYQFSEFAAFREGLSELARYNYTLWRISGVFKHFDPMRLIDPEHLSPTVTPTNIRLD